MPQIEFQVTTDLATVANTQIETNFEAVKEWLTEELAPYATMVVTPDAIADAKKTRANLNKVADGIDSQRKAIKKIWMKPYEEYEAKCKELTGIVSEAKSNIDGQIKAMENEVKEEKKQRLRDLFDSNSADISSFISFEDVFDQKWLNATFNEIDAANSIVSQIEDVREGLDAIRGMNSPYEAAMLSEYGKSHNLSKAIAEGKRLEAIQKAEEERKAKEAAEVFAEEEGAAEETSEPPAPAQKPTAQFIRPVADDEPPRPKIYTLRLEISGTAEAFSALKRCITANGMEYSKI